MLKELRVYENLGTPAYFLELFKCLWGDGSWSIEQISEYFSNKIIDGERVFDGSVPLLEMAGIISIDEEGVIRLSYEYANPFPTERLFQQKLLESILFAFRKDDEFYSVFSNEHVSYDIAYRSAVIDYSAFGLKYANVRNLLINLRFLEKHPDFSERKLIISNYWQRFFTVNFDPEIRRRKIDIGELRERQELQSVRGEEAESFVLESEKKRLKNRVGIQWVAPYDAGAGYDILSFHNEGSNERRRFIEVKSYSGDKPYFYWSKNEVKFAKVKQGDYFIYLVDRNQIKDVDYEPIMIPDPVKNILSNGQWHKEVDKYYIERAFL